MTPAERFAANLKRLRRETGYSQETLAYFAGLNRTQIGRYESGDSLPRSEAVVKLAGALSVTPNDLLAGIKWEPRIYEPGWLVVDEEDA